MSSFAQHWSLDPDVTYLNHGSYGACPIPVLQKQAELRARLEREPALFFRQLEPLLDEARARLAAFVGAQPDDLVFVPNATSGVNTVVRSLQLEPGDELLTTDHAYNACRNALRWHEAHGVRVAAARVPFPLLGPWQVVEAVLGAVTPRTRLVLLDHVTSGSGLIFPVGELVRRLDERGIDTLVDGAHAPGMLPLQLDALGAAYYTGNCHKWLSSPKGAAFLHVRRDRQQALKPLAHGHGLNSARTDRSAFRLQHDWIATGDPTPWLCVPEALRFFESLLPWDELYARNHALAVEGRRTLLAALRAEAPAPEFMLGSLATIPVPRNLQQALFERHQIEVPFFHINGAAWLRISAQLYNAPAEYERCAQALVQLLA